MLQECLVWDLKAIWPSVAPDVRRGGAWPRGPENALHPGRWRPSRTQTVQGPLWFHHGEGAEGP